MNLQECADVPNTPDDEQNLSLHHGDGGQRKKKKRRSESRQEHPVRPNPPVQEMKYEEEEEEEEVHLPPPGGLTQSQKKKKKKKNRPTDEEEEEIVSLSTTELMTHQDGKKKRKWEEPPAAVDLHTPQKKKAKEEKISLPPPDGPTHDQKKKKKKKKKIEAMTSQEEDNNQPCIVMATICPDQEEALETHISTKKKKKSGSETPTQKDTEEKKKKKTKQGGMKSSQEEEEINWALVEEVQEYLPHIKKKCINQIKKILAYDLHRFRMFRQQGVPARLGRFSEQENQVIRENVADFMALTGISSVEKLLFPQRFKEEEATIKKLKKEHHFLERIADRIPRPCHQVYLRALKMFDEKNHMGRFSEEELAMLIKLHHLHGNNWKLISEKMDRSVFSLQKRFATIGVKHGAWSAEEEKRLKQAVREHLESRTRNASPGSGLTREQLSKMLPWREISQKVQSRSWTQCRTKWLFFLEHRMSWYGNVFNRGPEGCKAKIRLISTLYNMSVEDIADINWEEVAQTVGEVTSWGVQRMFNRLKQRKVPHFHHLSFGEIIDFLFHHVVPVLQKRLSSCCRWAELQEQHVQDRYQLSDIFNSDIEEEDSS